MASREIKKKKKKNKGLRIFLYSQLVLIVLVIAGVAFYYGGGYAKKISGLKKEAEQLVKHSTKDTFRKNQTSVAFDVNGNKLSVMKGEKDTYYLSFNEIPENVKMAAISIEDKKFYKHGGVDYKAIIRAVWAMVRNGEIKQGASTITQQLARNVFLNQDKTWERKIEEIYIAVELEKKYSKNEILEFYLNNIYFANGYYGLEAASQGYFGKGSEDLTLSEAAFLMAIPNRPNTYDPIKHIDNTLKRRDRILKNMYTDGVITELEYLEASQQAISMVEPKNIYNNYMETYMYYCATKDLMEMDGFVFKDEFENEDEKKAYNQLFEESYNENNKKLFTGGYRIYTSFDSNIQEKLQAAVDEKLAPFQEKNEEGTYDLQGAAVCIDNYTGTVKAMVGGRSQDYEGYTLNRAFQSYRQPGSSIKPLIVYAPALESGYDENSVLVDEPIEDGPENVDGAYFGEISLRTAVEKSRNTTAWKLFQEIGPQKGLSYIERMGFKKVTGQDRVPAAAIGGFSTGVSPLEMAAAYATLDNDGNYREPTCILKITDSDGNVLYQSMQKEKEIYQKDTARNMTDILRGVMVNGTAKGYDLGEMPCAGKTGTTNDRKDGWFVGYTRYYTTSVWVGADMPKRMQGLGGTTYPLYIWHDFMADIHQGLSPMDFLPALGGVDRSDDSESTEETGEEEAAVSGEDGE